MHFSPSVPISKFTRLHARICQAEIGFTVKVHMHHHLDREGGYLGAEMAESIEMASGMIGQLANQFSITQQFISISIVMNNFKDGTLH
jgi:hypothetical protein